VGQKLGFTPTAFRGAVLAPKLLGEITDFPDSPSGCRFIIILMILRAFGAHLAGPRLRGPGKSALRAQVATAPGAATRALRAKSCLSLNAALVFPAKPGFII